MQNLKVVIFASLFSACFSVETEDNNEKIVGGKFIPISDAPYQVSLHIDGIHWCGGSIIHENVIVTAAHCLVGRVERDILVRAGTKHQGLGGELLRVFKIIRHPSYDPETEFMDVALLQLARNITLKPREKEIIKLAAQGEVTADGSLAMVTGWGETKSVKDSNKMLRGVIIPIVNIDVCKQTNKNLMDDVICAGDYEKGGKDACQGDSGGPLRRLSDRKLIGIVSRGIGCAEPKFPGIYLSIAVVREWIDQNIKTKVH